MFEKHVATLIYICTFRNISYSVNHNLVLTHQQSCQTALTDLIDRWLKFMDDGNLIGTIFLDLKKAFDTVDHFILCRKLHYYKISRQSVAWFKSYLSSRTQKIGLGNDISNHEPVKQGVPQLSILEPLLFILFINDLPLENIKCNIDMYADDTTLHCHSNRKSEIERSLNEDLNTVNKWCIQNNMLINPTKTTCMLIGTAQRIATVTNELNINLENQFIKNINTQKFLGIYIDNNLDWKQQVDHICKYINSRLFLLSKIKKYLDKKSRILFFNSILISYQFLSIAVMCGET